MEIEPPNPFLMSPYRFPRSDKISLAIAIISFLGVVFLIALQCVHPSHVSALRTCRSITFSLKGPFYPTLACFVLSSGVCMIWGYQFEKWKEQQLKTLINLAALLLPPHEDGAAVIQEKLTRFKQSMIRLQQQAPHSKFGHPLYFWPYALALYTQYRLRAPDITNILSSLKTYQASTPRPSLLDTQIWAPIAKMYGEGLLSSMRLSRPNPSTPISVSEIDQQLRKQGSYFLFNRNALIRYEILCNMLRIDTEPTYQELCTSVQNAASSDEYNALVESFSTEEAYAVIQQGGFGTQIQQDSLSSVRLSFIEKGWNNYVLVRKQALDSCSNLMQLEAWYQGYGDNIWEQYAATIDNLETATTCACSHIHTRTEMSNVFLNSFFVQTESEPSSIFQFFLPDELLKQKNIQAALKKAYLVAFSNFMENHLQDSWEFLVTTKAYVQIPFIVDDQKFTPLQCVKKSDHEDRWTISFIGTKDWGRFLKIVIDPQLQHSDTMEDVALLKRIAAYTADMMGSARPDLENIDRLDDLRNQIYTNRSKLQQCEYLAPALLAFQACARHLDHADTVNQNLRLLVSTAKKFMDQQNTVTEKLSQQESELFRMAGQFVTELIRPPMTASVSVDFLREQRILEDIEQWQERARQWNKDYNECMGNQGFPPGVLTDLVERATNLIKTYTNEIDTDQQNTNLLNAITTSRSKLQRQIQSDQQHEVDRKNQQWQTAANTLLQTFNEYMKTETATLTIFQKLIEQAENLRDHYAPPHKLDQNSLNLWLDIKAAADVLRTIIDLHKHPVNDTENEK